MAASSFRKLQIQNRTRIIELLVVLRFRSSYLNMPRMLANFGIGPLVQPTRANRRMAYPTTAQLVAPLAIVPRINPMHRCGRASTDLGYPRSDLRVRKSADSRLTMARSLRFARTAGR